MAKDDGGAAFPHETRGGDMGYQMRPTGRPGMTLRDYFANGVCSAAMTNARGLGGETDESLATQFSALARLSYMVADAMLKERAK